MTFVPLVADSLSPFVFSFLVFTSSVVAADRSHSCSVPTFAGRRFAVEKPSRSIHFLLSNSALFARVPRLFCCFVLPGGTICCRSQEMEYSRNASRMTRGHQGATPADWSREGQGQSSGGAHALVGASPSVRVHRSPDETTLEACA